MRIALSHGRFRNSLSGESVAAIDSRLRGNPAVLGNESVRPEALRPRLSARLPLERFDNSLRSGDKSSGSVAFSRQWLRRQAARCREFEVMSYPPQRPREVRERLPVIG